MKRGGGKKGRDENGRVNNIGEGLGTTRTKNSIKTQQRHRGYLLEGDWGSMQLGKEIEMYQDGTGKGGTQVQMSGSRKI